MIRRVLMATGLTAALCAGFSPAANLVSNPGFESYATVQYVGDIPDDWTGYSTGDPSWSEGWFLSLQAGDTATNFDPRHGGRYGGAKGGSDQVGMPYDRSGGIYQQVSGLTPGASYHALAWFFTDARQVSGGAALYPGDAQCRIGVDPNGGTDPAMATWSPWSWNPADAELTWLQIHVNFTAAGDTATVFLEYKQQNSRPRMICGFDDVEVDEGDASDAVVIKDVHWANVGFDGAFYERHVAWYTYGFTPPSSFYAVYANGDVAWADDASWQANPGVYTNSVHGQDPPDETHYHNTRDFPDPVAGLAPATLYHFRIISQTSGMDDGVYEFEDTMPTNISGVNVYPGVTTVEVYCDTDNAPGVSGLQMSVEYGYAAGSYYWTAVGDPPQWNSGPPGHYQHHAEVASLYPDTVYHMRIKVVCDGHPTAYSDDIEVRTLPDFAAGAANDVLMNSDFAMRTEWTENWPDPPTMHVYDGQPAWGKVADYWYFQTSGLTAAYSWFRGDPAWQAPSGSYNAQSMLTSWGKGTGYLYQGVKALPEESYTFSIWHRGENTNVNPGYDLASTMMINTMGEPYPFGENVIQSQEWWYVPSTRQAGASQRYQDTGGPYGNGWYRDTVTATTPADSNAITVFDRAYVPSGGAEWYILTSTDAQLFGTTKVTAGGGEKSAGTLVDGWNLISVPVLISDDDEQLLDLGEMDTDAVCVGPGPNGILDTFAEDDDVEDGDDQVIRVGPNGICDTEAEYVFGDDTQEIPVGSGARCVGPGADGILQTTPAGDDITYGDYVMAGADGLCDTVAGDTDGDGVVESDPAEVFADLVAAGNVIATNLYNYTPGSGYGLYPTNFTRIEIGRGYWLRLTNAVDNRVRGELLGCAQRIPLAQGWNMIGHPLNVAVPLEECRIAFPGEVTTGADGICDTAASGDDVQVIPVGQGEPDTVAIFPGSDGVLQSTAGGDDEVAGPYPPDGTQ